MQSADELEAKTGEEKKKPNAVGKTSLFNMTILTNYILSLCLMKNLAVKFIEPQSFEN